MASKTWREIWIRPEVRARRDATRRRSHPSVENPPFQILFRGGTKKAALGGTTTSISVTMHGLTNRPTVSLALAPLALPDPESGPTT